MRTLKFIISVVLCVVLVASLSVVGAKEVEYAPYSGYEYNSDSESVAAPISYTQKQFYTHIDMGLSTPLSSPTDMCRMGDKFYLLDSGNSRIIELDCNLKVKSVRDVFLDADGVEYSIDGAQGMAVSNDGLVYIADTQNNRILVVNGNTVVKVISKPDTTLVGYDYSFDVTKVLINNQGNLFAVSQSVNNGAFVFSPNGEFLYFFGRNTVQRTVDVLINYIRKQFMTREQLQKLQNFSPATISNFDIDNEGFVYTIMPTGSSTGATVRKLNFKGKDIMATEGIISSYGDLEGVRGILTNNNYTSFLDIDIDDNQFIHLLDSGRGKMFEYTQNGQLIAVYGGYGDQIGMFETPVAIETIGDKVLVLDTGAGGIVEFAPTDYQLALRAAFLELDTSDWEKAEKLWAEVLRYNTNSQYPYYGLGMAYEKNGNYKEAMAQFRLASTKEEYSDAFREYRKQFVSENLAVIVACAVILIALVVLAVGLIKKRLTAKQNGAFSVLENRYSFPLYVLAHPSDGFQQFKYRKELPSFAISAVIVIAFFFIKVIGFFATGYVFNSNDPEDYTIFSTVIGSIAIYLLFVIGNWAVCSLMDGNGTMKEIASVTAYSLIPYLISQVLYIILSNMLTLDEGMILSIVCVVGLLWSGLVLIIGLSQVHQYYIGKTILTFLLTLFAMVVIAVIIFLLFSLMQQVLYFFNSLWEEWQLR